MEIFSSIFLHFFYVAQLTPGIAIAIVVLLVLLFISGVISGSEVAYFSLTPGNIRRLEKEGGSQSDEILSLCGKPKELLATILILNNFVNVSIILLSSLLAQNVLQFSGVEVFDFFLSGSAINFLVNVVVITFLILLFGEVVPKIYASNNALKVAKLTAMPFTAGLNIFKKTGVLNLLIHSTGFIDKSISGKSEAISVDDLSQALELADKRDINKEEERILKGIVKFGNTDVKQVMTQRLDVLALPVETPYSELIEKYVHEGYSRIPVYEESFDNIKGILFLKDLLPYINEKADFDWVHLLREPFYVPENKKIDDLLQDFQEKKIHMAVVVDEYGGSSGIITLDDVIEEIVGDISDEFDVDDDIMYSKADSKNYIFKGKTALNDVYRVLDIDGENFESEKGEADTLAGFILELTGKMPKKNDKVKFDRYLFTVESADSRRVKQIKVTILDEKPDNSKDTTSGITAALLIFASLFLSSCSDDYTPKPRGYHRIEFAEPRYVKLEKDCPFIFERSVHTEFDYSRIDQNRFPCRFNLYYPNLDAKLYFTYFGESVQDSLVKYTEDSRELVKKHIVKARDIEEVFLSNDRDRVYGITFDFKGSTATNYQFFVTDSVNHYLHASLYFEFKPNPDSIAPAEDYLQRDIEHLLQSFKWRVD